MSTIKITILFHDDIDFNDFVGLQFNLVSGSLKSKVYITDTRDHVKSYWSSFINAMSENKKSSIVYDDCNGQFFMATENGITTFHISRSGGVACGEMEISIPNEICIPEYKRIEEIFLTKFHGHRKRYISF